MAAGDWVARCMRSSHRKTAETARAVVQHVSVVCVHVSMEARTATSRDLSKRLFRQWDHSGERFIYQQIQHQSIRGREQARLKHSPSYLASLACGNLGRLHGRPFWDPPPRLSISGKVDVLIKER